MPVPYWAGHYIGLPFAEHGRDVQGLDCWGLVRLVLSEQFGIAVPSYAREYRSTRAQDELGALIKRETQAWEKIESGNESLGDVVVLRLRGQPMHVGMVLGDQTMLHIEQFINSAIERYSSRRWSGRVEGFYRHKGMRNGMRVQSENA